MDQCLTGDLWVKEICKKSFALLNRFYGCGGMWLPVRARRALVNALVMPVLDYGNVLHSGILAINKRKLQRIQNYCMRFVYAKGRRESIRQLYAENEVMPVNVRHDWLLLGVFYKAVVKQIGLQYIAEKLT